MTSARRTISGGALLVALMAGSGALAGGAAYADVLGDTTSSVPLPAPLPSVPLLTDPSPSPSPSPTTTATATPAPDQSSPTGTTTTTDASTAPAPASDSSSTSSSEVAASTNTAPAPVAAPAAAPVAASPVGARPVTAQPGHAAAPAMTTVAKPLLAPVSGAPAAATTNAAARLDLADGRANGLGSFSGFPQLTAGSLTLPGLPELPGLRPMIAPQTSQLAPLLTGGTASPTDVAVVRAGHSSPVQPGSTGIVLFVMASAAGAAGLARVRIYRRSVISR